MQAAAPKIMQPGEDRDERRVLIQMGFLVAIFFLVEGVLRATHLQLGVQLHGGSGDFGRRLVIELTSAVATLTAFALVVVPLARRLPLEGVRWARRLPYHFVGVIVYSVLKTMIIIGLRAAILPTLGFGPWAMVDLSYALPMEAATDLSSYVLLSAGVQLWYGWRRRRADRLRAASLELHLGAARLAALQGQLEPHFLFNALNTISSVVYEDAKKADSLISQLADLLRTGLRKRGDAEIPVSEELGLVQRYISLIRARFGDRLDIQIQASPVLSDYLVPTFTIQPLVENAVLHGPGASPKGGQISVEVRLSGDVLEIEVCDSGCGDSALGPPSGDVSDGTGLDNIRSRLALLHGPAAGLKLTHRRGGGTSALAWLPARKEVEMGNNE